MQKGAVAYIKYIPDSGDSKIVLIVVMAFLEDFLSLFAIL
jgi:hypothetical protein